MSSSARLLRVFLMATPQVKKQPTTRQNPAGCVLDDCPKPQEVQCQPTYHLKFRNKVGKSKPQKFTGSIEIFIQELKEGLPQEWVNRFDFTKLQKSDKQENTWHIPVKNRIWREYAYSYEYPAWCSVS